MPFEKVDPIAEAMELQIEFKGDSEAVELFRQYELAHRENALLEQKEIDLRNRLVELRKKKKITQKDLEAKSGLTQQAISRFETIGGGNLKTILRYTEGLDCQLVPMESQDSAYA